MFIKALENSGNVSVAAMTAGIDRRTAYDRKKRDPAFVEGWKSALKVAGDLLEAEARRRAMEGIDEPVIHQGQLMGQWVTPSGEVVAPETPGSKLIPLTIKKYSDTLLIFLLKGNKPKKFSDRAQVQHTVKGEIDHTHQVRSMMELADKDPEARKALDLLADRQESKN